jgi:hypothetical protein
MCFCLSLIEAFYKYLLGICCRQSILQILCNFVFIKTKQNPLLGKVSTALQWESASESACGRNGAIFWCVTGISFSFIRQVFVFSLPLTYLEIVSDLQKSCKNWKDSHMSFIQVPWMSTFYRICELYPSSTCIKFMYDVPLLSKYFSIVTWHMTVLQFMTDYVSQN